MRRTSAHPTLVLPYAGRNHTLGSASGKSLMLGSEPRLVGPLSNTNIGIGAHVMSSNMSWHVAVLPKSKAPRLAR